MLSKSLRLFSTNINNNSINNNSINNKYNNNNKLSLNNINQKIISAQYAVRGELVIKALEYQDILKNNSQNNLPFNNIIFCNIGNPQELNQKPISYFRQVLSLCVNPELLLNKNISKIYPTDVIKRATDYLENISGGTGAYSNSQGVTIVREEVAKFLKERDGHDASIDDIFLTDGASSAVKMGLTTLIRDENDGILTPIPQYPLYSATITLQGGSLIPYLLDEGKDFATTASNLEAALAESKRKNPKVLPRALVVINPGNPTGSMLELKDMQDIVNFCVKENMVLLADEVYQTNVWGNKPFISFKKVACDMGIQNQLEMISFHSVSKGFVGECGRRGGFMELLNIDPEVKMQIYKQASISLCSNIEGQIMVGLMSNPPKKGDESYPLYVEQRDDILSSLKRRAAKLSKALSNLEGISCPPVDGSLYLFPNIKLPSKAIAAAKAAGKVPDVFYCLDLLANTGIVTVPGSGFGQADGTFHFRTTILPQENEIDSFVERFTKFHKTFMTKYA